MVKYTKYRNSFGLAGLANSCSSLDHYGPTRICVRHETVGDTFESSDHPTCVCESKKNCYYYYFFIVVDYDDNDDEVNYAK